MDNKNHVHFSHNNSKLGFIPSVNLPPVLTCRKNAPCYEKCYARKGCFAFKHNKELLANNYELYLTNPEQYEREVEQESYCSKFFRWHSAGDIPDTQYLDMMARVAKANPTTNYLAFTKQYEIVNNHIDTCGPLPNNLKIVFSVWNNFVPHNKHNLPMAYVNLKDEECKIPHNAMKCSGYCAKCVSTKHSCWDMNNGDCVVFNEH